MASGESNLLWGSGIEEGLVDELTGILLSLEMFILLSGLLFEFKVLKVLNNRRSEAKVLEGMNFSRGDCG